MPKKKIVLTDEEKKELKLGYGGATSTQPDIIKPYFVSGAWRTEDWFRRWQRKVGRTWSSQEISNLQTFLGLEPTGKWDLETAEAQREYFEIKARIGKRGALETIRQKETEAQIKAQAKAEKIAGEAKARQAELLTMQEDVTKLHEQITGVKPSQANLQWGIQKEMEGWNSLDFYNFLRQTPGFQQRYPGIPNDMSPQDYDALFNQVNARWMQRRGRPITREEFARIGRREFIPLEKEALGQPMPLGR